MFNHKNKDKCLDKNLPLKRKEKESFPQPRVISQSYTNKSVLLDAPKGRGVGSFGCSFCTWAGRTRWWLFVEEGNLSREVQASRRCGGIGWPLRFLSCYFTCLFCLFAEPDEIRSAFCIMLAPILFFVPFCTVLFSFFYINILPSPFLLHLHLI